MQSFFSSKFFILSLPHTVLVLYPDLNCDEMTSVKDGSYDVSGDYFGARVIYSCNEGFFMSGPKERVCQGDGSWSDSAPTCKEKGKRDKKVIKNFS